MILSPIVELDIIDSTNTFLKERAGEFPTGTVVRAKHQTAGRGQFDRVWIDNPGENILVSILLKNVPSQKLETLKNITASAVMAILRQEKINARFKEPNDIYVGEQKLAGFLVETKMQGMIAFAVIIGIGLNVNQTDFIHVKAISMAQLLGISFDVDLLFARLIDELQKQLTEWE